MLWCLFAMGSATAFSFDGPRSFGTDWSDAVRFVNEHRQEWQSEWEYFNVDAQKAIAVVFPEMVRFSAWKDRLEMTAVNGMYVSGGKEAADFSVGRFQMKPSFAETIERAWNRSPFSESYGFSFDVSDSPSARRSRLRRLDTFSGQCRYLALFILLQYHLHPQLRQLSDREQIRALATFYNCSLTLSWDEMIRRQNVRSFHTDIVRTPLTTCYCYADIAEAYYLRAKRTNAHHRK